MSSLRPGVEYYRPLGGEKPISVDVVTRLPNNHDACSAEEALEAFRRGVQAKVKSSDSISERKELSKQLKTWERQPLEDLLAYPESIDCSVRSTERRQRAPIPYATYLELVKGISFFEPGQQVYVARVASDLAGDQYYERARTFPAPLYVLEMTIESLEVEVYADRTTAVCYDPVKSEAFQFASVNHPLIYGEQVFTEEREARSALADYLRQVLPMVGSVDESTFPKFTFEQIMTMKEDLKFQPRPQWPPFWEIMK